MKTQSLGKVPIWAVIVFVVSGLLTGGGIIFGATRYASETRFNSVEQKADKNTADVESNEKRIDECEKRSEVILNELENIKKNQEKSEQKQDRLYNKLDKIEDALRGR